MRRDYEIHLDLIKPIDNQIMIFFESDENTASFLIRITNKGKEIDLTGHTATLGITKPSKDIEYQEGKIINNRVEIVLEANMMDMLGQYTGSLLLQHGNSKVIVSPIRYEILDDEYTN